VARVRQVSICPIALTAISVDSHHSELPLRITDSLSVADVSDILQETTFGPLAPQFFSESEADSLKRVRYAFVREFECDDQERPSEDEKSAAQLFQLYLALKVIRPCSGRFQVLHFDMSQSVPRLPRGERNDYPTIPCDCERLNSIRWADFEELVAFAPSLLRELKTAVPPISQAILSLEIGYRADFLQARHLLWVIGLDALFTSTEWENQGAKLSARRIEQFLGSAFQVYSGDHFASLGLTPPTSRPLNETLRDIYRLRNYFAHGSWPDKEWAGNACRKSMDACRDINYAESLSEAASCILRGSLRQILSNPQSVDLFNHKSKINAHFASLGLVRRKKP
jgi:hypothetical protein